MYQFKRVSWAVTTIAVVGMVGIGTAAQASSTYDASSLLTQATVDELAGWLGQGDISLTQIFDKTAGSTSEDWHTAVDGQGPTFTIIQVLGGTNGDGTTVAPQIVGGYDPVSWSSVGNYITDPTDIGRTAFLFNLTSSLEQTQQLSTTSSNGAAAGSYQTFDAPYYGPAFGYRLDLAVDGTLNSGQSVRTSYGSGDYNTSSNGANILGYSGSSTSYSPNLSIGAIETFTIAPAAVTAPVPEPAFFQMAGLLGMGGLGLLKRKFRR